MKIQTIFTSVARTRICPKTIDLKNRDSENCLADGCMAWIQDPDTTVKGFCSIYQNVSVEDND